MQIGKNKIVTIAISILFIFSMSASMILIPISKCTHTAFKFQHTLSLTWLLIQLVLVSNVTLSCGWTNSMKMHTLYTHIDSTTTN